MNLSEMHKWFRQYAQQMGMQNTRAILPEQIDRFINTSIHDYVNELIRSNLAITNDRVITDNAKIGTINALRGLYKTTTIALNGTSKSNFDLDLEELNSGKISYTLDEDTAYGGILFFGDFAINYKKVTTGLYYSSSETKNVVYDSSSPTPTNYFPIRVIEDQFLADTLQDFVLAPRLRSPIVILTDEFIDSSDSDKRKIKISLYLGVPDGGISGDTRGTTTTNSLKFGGGFCPFKIRMSYLKNPTKVEYKADLGQDNIECDLPENTHIDILKHAVDLYRISVQGSLMSAQGQARNQNQEIARNNARDEGYSPTAND